VLCVTVGRSSAAPRPRASQRVSNSSHRLALVDLENGEHFKTGADSDSLILIKVLEAFDRAMNMLGQ
jgi:hypothetical protein